MAPAASPAEEETTEAASEAPAMATMMVLMALTESEKRRPMLPKLVKSVMAGMSRMTKTEGGARMEPRTCRKWERDADWSVPHCRTTVRPGTVILLPSLFTWRAMKLESAERVQVLVVGGMMVVLAAMEVSGRCQAKRSTVVLEHPQRWRSDIGTSLMAMALTSWWKASHGRSDEVAGDGNLLVTCMVTDSDSGSNPGSHA